MSSETIQARFRLYYWPIPFRGCFVSYLFAYRGAPLLEETDLERNAQLRARHPSEQPVPYVGPPLLHDLEQDRFLSQMPAMVPYVARELDLLPELCRRIGSEPSLARYVADEEQKYGQLYCGGQIEASIREMLEMDAR